MLAEWSAERQQIIFYSFDVIKEGRKFTLRFSYYRALRLELSPDGGKILLIHIGGKEQLEVFSLAEGGLDAVPLKGWNISENITWTVDSKALYVASPTKRGCALLYVDLRGKSKVVWEQRGGLSTVGVASPDGQQLAVTRWSLSSNVWEMGDRKCPASLIVSALTRFFWGHQVGVNHFSLLWNPRPWHAEPFDLILTLSPRSIAGRTDNLSAFPSAFGVGNKLSTLGAIQRH